MLLSMGLNSYHNVLIAAEFGFLGYGNKQEFGSGVLWKHPGEGVWLWVIVRRQRHMSSSPKLAMTGS